MLLKRCFSLVLLHNNIWWKIGFERLGGRKCERPKFRAALIGGCDGHKATYMSCWQIRPWWPGLFWNIFQTIHHRELSVGPMKCLEQLNTCCKHKIYFIGPLYVGRETTTKRIYWLNLRCGRQSEPKSRISPEKSKYFFLKSSQNHLKRIENHF